MKHSFPFWSFELARDAKFLDNKLAFVIHEWTYFSATGLLGAIGRLRSLERPLEQFRDLARIPRITGGPETHSRL